MLEYVESLLLEYGYQGLFVASFLASTVLPFGSEGFLVFLVSRGLNVLAVILVASVGNFLGSCTTYYIGMKGRKYVERVLHVKPSDMEKAGKYFYKYGSYALLLSWLPVVGDLLVVMAGILRLRLATFSVLVFVGKFLRYLVVAYAAHILL